MMELLGLILVIAGAVPATVFPFAYGWYARRVWWREPAGQALMVSTVALALLLDLTLLFAVVPVSRDVGMLITVIVVAVIAAGAWLKLGALVYEMRAGRRSVPPS